MLVGRTRATARLLAAGADEVQGLPPGRIRAQDFYAEQQPLHRETEYFFGLPWHYGVLHAFGGQTHLHGNMPLLEKQVRSVAGDPRAAIRSACMT